MMRNLHISVFLLLTALTMILGCTTSKIVAIEKSRENLRDSESANGGDTTTNDSSTMDTTTNDTSTIDTATNDTSTIDTATNDTSTTDTATTDTSTMDTATGDTSTMDTETVDTSTEDTATGDTSTVDSETDTESEPLAVMYQWNSSPELVQPPSGYKSIKEPTVLYYEDEWHIYGTIGTGYEWGMAYLSVDDWAKAGESTLVTTDVNPNLNTGYKASPQLFRFGNEEDSQWYLIYQTPAPAYSTSSVPNDMTSWSPATEFMSNPTWITIFGRDGIDYWLICDDLKCHLFFSDLMGGLYRSETAKADFPNGFSQQTTSEVMIDSKYALFQGCNVYRIQETGEYLLIVSAIDGGGGVERYFRSWTSDRLDGEWTPQAASVANPFASTDNVLGDEEWAMDGINAGEVLRTTVDETMTISMSDLQFLYHGATTLGPDGDYTLNDYSLGLMKATQTP